MIWRVVRSLIFSLLLVAVMQGPPARSSPARSAVSLLSASARMITSCTAPLTLTLEPGQNWPGSRSAPIPSDLPPGPLTVQLPLYPDAVPTQQQEAYPAISYPLDLYMNPGPRGLRPLRSVDVRDAATAASLGDEINHLPKVTGVTISCPMDDGSHDTLVFRDADGSTHPVYIGLRGCQMVAAPPAPAGRLWDDRRLLPRINALLHGPGSRSHLIALSIAPPGAAASNSRIVLANTDDTITGRLPLPFRRATRLAWSVWAGETIGVTRVTARGTQAWAVSLPALPPDPGMFSGG